MSGNDRAPHGNRLAGRTAVITGTASGQGRAGALLFAREGARVVGCDVNVSGAAETVDMVTSAGGTIVSLAPIDLTLEADAARLSDYAEEAFGGYDILWNNAASQRLGTVESQSVEDFEYTLTHELTLLFATIRHAVPALRRSGGGVIINTASVAASVGSGWVGNIAGMLSHSVGKAGVVRMSTVLAVELSPWNIRVNCISPGIIETPASRRIIGSEAAPGPLREPFLDQLLIRRIGSPDDVANAALFLASDDASYITGTNIVVDGGWTASGGLGRPDPDIGEKLREALASGALTAKP